MLVCSCNMNAKKIRSFDAPKQPGAVAKHLSPLELNTDAVSVHKGGIEFRSPTVFKEWAEMTVTLQSPVDNSEFQCSGVVIACSGNKHAGYRVSLVFTNISEHAQARLNSMARSTLGAG